MEERRDFKVGKGGKWVWKSTKARRRWDGAGASKSLEDEGAGGGLGDGERSEELQGAGLGGYRGGKRGSMKIEGMEIHL